MGGTAGQVEEDRAGRRRYYRAGAIGGGLALIVFLLILWQNGGIFSGSILGGFYEAQARAFRHLRWDVPNGSLGIEAFRNGSRSYMYFGPLPAILRMPLMFLFPGMDGRWTQPMMVVALVIGLVSASRLSWRVRTLARAPGTPVTTLEAFAAGLFVLVLGAGSVWLFLGSQAWVYHEAELWGAALTLAAASFVVDYVAAPRRRTIVYASALACLAVVSRPSVSFAAVVALLLLGAVSFGAPLRRFFGVPDESREHALALIVGAVVPIALYIYVNYAKFGTFFVFPSGSQVYSQVSVYRREMLAANGNSLFGMKFAPTAALQYFRPDALRFRSLVPFVDFPRTAHVLNGVTFDQIEPTSSLPSAMPIFFLLAIVGVIAVIRSGRRTDSSLPRMRIPILAAVAGCYTVVPYSYIAQRYLSDFIPLLVLAGLVGLQVVVRWAGDVRVRKRMLVGGLVVLALFSVWVNVGLAITYHWQSVLVPEGVMTEFVEQQYRWHRDFPGGDAPYVEQLDHLPRPPLARGTVVTLPDCGGVYWSHGPSWEQAAKWYALARTPASGQYLLRASFDHVDKTTIEPIVVRGSGNRTQTIAAMVRPGNRLRFGFASKGHDGLPHGPRSKRGYLFGPPLKFKPGKTYNLIVVMDPNNGSVSATFAGYVAFVFNQYELTVPQLQSYVFPTNQVAIGRNDVGAPTVPALLGRIRELRTPRPPICKLLGVDR